MRAGYVPGADACETHMIKRLLCTKTTLVLQSSTRGLLKPSISLALWPEIVPYCGADTGTTDARRGTIDIQPSSFIGSYRPASLSWRTNTDESSSREIFSSSGYTS